MPPHGAEDFKNSTDAEGDSFIQEYNTMHKRLLGAVAIAAAMAVSYGCSDSAASPPTYDSALDTASRAEQAATLQTLEALVNIETGPNDAVGMKEMGDYLVPGRLGDLGATVTRHAAAAGGVGENIVGTFQGTGGAKILLMAHMDTVYPRGSLARAPFQIDGNRAYGAGIADDKAGIAVILHALAMLNARGFRQYGHDHRDVQHGRGDRVVRLARPDPAVVGVA
ncbi:M20/M25/M40 family metallo-hydrolase [Cupriavidus pauculus]|uniref:M20/M25/M40 family metallo-hydrolase n=1 Tax=Cupriavidus pauculus TaxID=82633 RepID=UPI00207DFB22|nr:M20/M25/M40 family metallo-hydrolase [Cupriavidus pauculus]GJG95252.1 hypothetical protein CBA19C6_12205 [Cupriavidus pauculus]